MISKYWINRIINNYKRNSFLKFITSIFDFFNKILNPKHTGEFPFKYLFLKKRKAIMKFAKHNLDQLDDNKILNLGNYMFDLSKLNKNSIVYSFGVGTSISFEEEVARAFKCKVYCYDPTSMAIEWINNNKYDDDSILFSPIGIWTKDGPIKFFAQETDDPKISGGSINNLFKSDKFEYLECKKLKSFMEKNGHNKINLLKLDIEGAAIEVFKDMINDQIFPDQIIAEFEYSDDDDFVNLDFENWSSKLLDIIKEFKLNGYKCYYLPRFTHMAFSTIEICFIRND